jgi:hypothetical protein
MPPKENHGLLLWSSWDINPQHHNPSDIRGVVSVLRYVIIYPEHKTTSNSSERDEIMPNLEPTTSLGKLFIDERNVYIGLCPSEKYNPKKCKWYSILDIENPGLYVTNPKCDMKHRVTVDCEFVCDIPSEGLHIKKIVKSRIYCQHHPYAKDKHYEEWSEPGTISIIRGVIIQTYANAVNREIKQWEDKLCFLNDCIQEQARCAFLLPVNFSQATLEERYQAIRTALEYNPSLVTILDKYYNSLKE